MNSFFGDMEEREVEVGLRRDVDSGVKGGKQDINCLFPHCMEITVELMLQVSHRGHA